MGVVDPEGRLAMVKLDLICWVAVLDEGRKVAMMLTTPT